MPKSQTAQQRLKFTAACSPYGRGRPALLHDQLGSRHTRTGRSSIKPQTPHPHPNLTSISPSTREHRIQPSKAGRAGRAGRRVAYSHSYTYAYSPALGLLHGPLRSIHCTRAHHIPGTRHSTSIPYASGAGRGRELDKVHAQPIIVQSSTINDQRQRQTTISTWEPRGAVRLLPAHATTKHSRDTFDSPVP